MRPIRRWGARALNADGRERFLAETGRRAYRRQ